MSDSKPGWTEAAALQGDWSGGQEDGHYQRASLIRNVKDEEQWALLDYKS